MGGKGLGQNIVRTARLVVLSGHQGNPLWPAVTGQGWRGRPVPPRSHLLLRPIESPGRDGGGVGGALV